VRDPDGLATGAPASSDDRWNRPASKRDHVYHVYHEDLAVGAAPVTVEAIGAV
jgi:hypothetical protein